MNHLTPYLGAFYGTWSSFETILEMLCKRELKINNRQCHILFGSLTFQAKYGIAISLMKDSKDPMRGEIIAEIKRIPLLARRNHIAHSVISASKDRSIIHFWKRDITNGLKTKLLSFDERGLKNHFSKFHNAVVKLEALTGFSERSQKAFLNAIEAPK